MALKTFCEAKAVESGAIEPTPPRRETSEVRRFPARASRPKESTITSTSSVAVPVARPIAPPPVPSTEEEGAWQLSWVWIPSSVNPPFIGSGRACSCHTAEGGTS